MTFCKRKKAMIKKAMELASVCDIFISINIFDRKKPRLITYNSDEDFTANAVAKLSGPEFKDFIRHEKYQGQDEEALEADKTKSEKSTDTDSSQYCSPRIELKKLGKRSNECDVDISGLVSVKDLKKKDSLGRRGYKFKDVNSSSEASVAETPIKRRKFVSENSPVRNSEQDSHNSVESNKSTPKFPHKQSQ